MNIKLYPVTPPKIVAIATDKYLTPKYPFPDPINLDSQVPTYGPDFTFGAPDGDSPPPVLPVYDVGKNEAILKPKMEKLLRIFASADTTGVAKRLFAKFLGKQTTQTYFEDADLNRAAAAHQNIKDFCIAALAAPNQRCQGSHHRQVVGTPRIHQALKQANWDIKKIIAPTDLGVPALNKGSKAFSTGDFANGLGLMINGVQYVYVVATHYHYDQSNNKYCINLKYHFYDVFGLDNDDLEEFGAQRDDSLTPAAKVGITAWWQLQHQHGYAPLVTRIVVENTYEEPIGFF